MKFVHYLALLAAPVAVAMSLAPITANAASIVFQGAVYDGSGSTITSLFAAQSVINNAATPAVTFEAESLKPYNPFNNGNTADSVVTLINNFFNNPVNIVTNGSGPTFDYTVWHITGYVDIAVTSNNFAAQYVNDGLNLTVAGVTVFDQVVNSGGNVITLDLPTGSQPFELYYWNSAAGGTFNLKMNDAAFTAAAASVPVPLPAALPLLLSGLGLLGTRIRRKG